MLAVPPKRLSVASKCSAPCSSACSKAEAGLLVVGVADHPAAAKVAAAVVAAAEDRLAERSAAR
jgi:hypothetical protein